MEEQKLTKEQLDTLVLIKSMEELVRDEHEDFPTLNGVVESFVEGITVTDEDCRQLVMDICMLTEKGYLESDGTADMAEEARDMDPSQVLMLVGLPEVECITPKGQAALDAWEKEMEERKEREEKESTDKGTDKNDEKHYHFSILGGVSFNATGLNVSCSLFGTVAGKIKELLKV